METRKKKSNTRPHVISVRLNDTELAQLENLAAESDCSMAEILRRGLERMTGASNVDSLYDVLIKKMMG